MEKHHASSRSAVPNGMSVRTWWYAMPCRRHAARHAAISRRTVSPYTRASSRGRTTTLAADSGSRNRTSGGPERDRKSTRLNSSHGYISYAVFCLKKKKQEKHDDHQLSVTILTTVFDATQCRCRA